ncbi:hypothetical protein FN846DRAFT_955010 [Sphaerosporella brunnea]|uniref:Uncharacterized protein n=1 Tax=Sphaerosporella brunnea TaxID=1250544 RepID=A0A5J5EUM0_9PEZI|nr:hypothetical protein FN846DRAFT_955010 [Sphaerosporella brunnea]
MCSRPWWGSLLIFCTGSAADAALDTEPPQPRRPRVDPTASAEGPPWEARPVTQAGSGKTSVIRDSDAQLLRGM